MDLYTQPAGFLGTGASLLADITLLVYLLLILPALIRGALLWWVAFVLVEWRKTKAEPGAIFRTMTVRFPAFEASIPALQSLRTAKVR